jgi:murein DD-endopeptidase MepM/ murein hydrolase activator NlpD
MPVDQRNETAPWRSAGASVPRSATAAGRADPRPAMIITATYSPARPSSNDGSNRHLVTLSVLTLATSLVVFLAWQFFGGSWRPAVFGLGHRSAETTVAIELDGVSEPVSVGPEELPNGPPRKPRASERLPPVSAMGFIWPTTGVISQEFGCTDFELEPWNASLGCRFHYGIDIANGAGTPILAAKAGRVVFAGWQDGDGFGYRVVLIDPDGVQTIYAHLCCPPDVQAGQEVSQSEQIGLMGTTGASSGSHLHFGVEVDGVTVDPRGYLPDGAPDG